MSFYCEIIKSKSCVDKGLMLNLLNNQFFPFEICGVRYLSSLRERRGLLILIKEKNLAIFLLYIGRKEVLENVITWIY
jgi:hypothetical protein